MQFRASDLAQDVRIEVGVLGSGFKVPESFRMQLDLPQGPMPPSKHLGFTALAAMEGLARVRDGSEGFWPHGLES